MSRYDISPFVKWAGGKGQLLEKIIERMPKDYDRYFEPFVGGGAVLFGIQPEKARINDINSQLINVYKLLKKSPNEIISELSKLDKENCTKELYLEHRQKYNDKVAQGQFDVECAALMIWLNKHCFNGLYRVNSKGLFNVPWNNKTTGNSFVEQNLLDIGKFMKNVEISNMDFEDFCKDARKGDFVYFDSPYLPESKTADFTSYTKDGFSMKDHTRLADLFKKLSEAGVYVMLSNNDVELVHELYGDFNIESLDVKRMINRNSSKRTGKEVIVTNYEWNN